MKRARRRTTWLSRPGGMLSALAGLLVTGCAGGSQSGRTTVLPPAAAVQASASILDHAEIAAAGLPPASSLFDAIVRLRPEYLASRPGGRGFEREEPVVYINGARQGAVETLRDVSAHWVTEVRFLRSTEARAMLGPSATREGGAIVVRLRHERL